MDLKEAIERLRSHQKSEIQNNKNMLSCWPELPKEFFIESTKSIMAIGIVLNTLETYMEMEIDRRGES